MNKFHAIPTTTADGIRHDSKAEASRWDTLKLRERAGEISDLQRQVEFPLLVNGIQIGKYKCDFLYRENGGRVIEDVKGMRTPLFNWKAKHMAAQGDPVTVYPPKKRKERKCWKLGKSSPSEAKGTGSSRATPRSRKPSRG